MKIFDTHAHYDDEDFDMDREELIASMRKQNICAIANIGAAMSGCEKTLELIREYNFFYGAIGIHPSDIGDLEDFGDDDKAIDTLRTMALSDPKVVAIGEIGLTIITKTLIRHVSTNGLQGSSRLQKSLRSLW